MEPQTIELSRLQELSATSLQLTYNTDGADTLSMTLRPEQYERLPLAALDRLTVTDGGRVMFSGIVPMEANCSDEAAAGKTVEVELQSDYYILDHTVFAKRNTANEVVFARSPSKERTTTIRNVCVSVRDWMGEYLPCGLSCDADAVCPSPANNGTAPCSTLLTDAMRWAPDTVLVQRYGSEGNAMLVTTPDKLGETLELSAATHPMQSVSLQARNDLQVPVCALVGGVHATYPSGADIRTLGAFVYAVPLDNDDNERGGAGSSPASSKMLVKGLHLPDRVIFEGGPKEYDADVVQGKTDTVKFIQRLLPEYAAFIPYGLKAGHCLVQPVLKEAFEDELQEDDEDAKAPVNYSSDLQNWSADGGAIYVHTEGSFPASSQRRKNVRGLLWCRATVSLVLAVRMSHTEVPAELRAVGEELFPGRRKASDGERYGYVRKVFTVNLISKRSKKYDPATNKLLSSDSNYNDELDSQPDENPTMQDYKTAMEQYWRAASQLQHEGSISMLYDGTLNPAELTGRWVTVQGMRSAWESMQAVIRSVSWDYGQRKLSLSVGPRSVMGFSEYLERRVLARNRGRDWAQREALPYDVRDEESQKELEKSMSVSPSISSKTDSTSTGRWVKPFTLFTNPENKKLTLKGGTFKRKGQTFVVEDSDTQYEKGVPNQTAWVEGSAVKLKMWRRTGTDVWTFDIYQ